MPRPSSHSHPARGSAPVAWLAALVVAVAGGADPAAAARMAEPSPAGVVSLRLGGGVRLADPETRRALEAAPPWRAFIARHGAWSALWNVRTRSPHRALGPAIRIAARLDRPEQVETAVRAFIAAHPELFGAPTLETARVRRVRGLWYVGFRQSAAGLPVLWADWEFRVTSEGDLFAFGADAHQVPAGDGTGARLPGAVARVAARAGLRFDPGRDRVEGGTTPKVLPVATERGLDYRVVLEARVLTAEPPGDWLTYVDAASGEVLWRQNRVRHAIGGTVTGTVHPRLPTDPPTSGPFRDLSVTVGGNTVVTSAIGAYSATASGTVTVSAQLRGPYCDVNRQDGIPDASFTAQATNPATVDISWESAHEAERDAFYHLNLVHAYVKALDPGLDGLDYPMPCAVNINATCNAFWDGTGVNFYRAGDGCPNTATLPDVVYHEYGHGVNDKLYIEAGPGDGMVNGALHEGLADVLAAFIQDDPTAGKGFFGPGTILRSLDNDARWPEQASPDPHITGLIVGGAFWDLRQAVGLTVAANLSHFAKYGQPDDPDDGVAMNEFFVETLVADKGQGNINNGTPHFAEILAAFNAHGIGTGLFMHLSHTPLADQPGTGPYPVAAVATYDPIHPATFGGFAGPPQLHYAVNGGSWQTQAMSSSGSGGQYAASIPSQTGAVVSYYLSLTDVYGVTITAPGSAPSNAYQFIAGPTITAFTHDQEEDQGWAGGADGDDAVTGLWVWTAPVGTWVSAPLEVQPSYDHTPEPGILCWVTGNAIPGQPPGTNDVDGGRTTVTTALFDATIPGLASPAVSYYRWYTNEQGGDPGTDHWRVDISNDAGLTWVPVENTTRGDPSWQRILVPIAGFVTPTDQMQMRFVAEDVGGGSLVEAAVDDLSLFGFQPVVGVGQPPSRVGLTLAITSAHPTNGPLRLGYALPAAGPVTLRLYDLRGRAVRTLASGWQEAGSHHAEWDGRDDAGAPLASGAYFARLEAGGSVVSRALVHLR